jgi:hypothetical protein
VRYSDFDRYFNGHFIAPIDMDRPEGARIYNQIRPIISEHPYDGADARRELYESNTTMPRGEPVGPDFKQAFTDAAENVEKTATSSARAAAGKGEPGLLGQELRAFDEEVKAALGVSEPGEVKGVPRGKLNEVTGPRLEKAEMLLNELFIAKELYDEGMKLGEFIDHLRVATDSSAR